ncbi:Putative membrane protein insertion efficiency factor [Desulfonema limicola]|uniref:Membrane protein insertion efficiency factor n=1 Tax=Desulfonema limicola TaxID=45656 RepID=A0A975B4C5_9BACT|nr:Putative membrane protein insertion efficiency factor [Desulfonema limicola]
MPVVRRFAALVIFLLLPVFLNGCTSTALAPVNFFKNYISNADGNRCPMHPSCAAYSAEAIKKHGPLLGWIMTFDRLMRCGRDEISISSTIKINNNYYCNDPVSNNDFWWYDLNQDGQDVIVKDGQDK